jgi:hypothetical protein
MTNLTRRRRILVGTIAAAAALVAAAPLAHAGPDEPDVPTRIAVPAGHKLFLVGHATGVQIYRCNTTATGGYAWGLLAPRATLTGDNGKTIATHFAGPTWQATDGSTVVGSKVDGVTVDPTAVPWLLLAKASSTVGADGTRLTATTYIQRINTVGGLPPSADACNVGTVGTTAEIPYTADYEFWKASGGA